MRNHRHRKHDLLGVLHLYREQTGETDVPLLKVAEYALSKLHWEMPAPISEAERLASDLARAAREEVRYDPSTNLPYRVNHPYPGVRDGVQTTLWTDMDKAARGPMQASLQLRRNQMVDDGYRLSLDADHWNSNNATEKPISLIFDFTEDIQERKSGPSSDQQAS